MQSRRPLGRGLALVVAALLLCVPALSSCGFNKLLDKPYTQADGTNYRKGSVYVLNAVIAAAQSGSGTLIASFSNQSESRTATLDAVAGAGGNTVTAPDFEPVSIAPMGFVNLADDSTKITVSGNFGAGDVVPLSLSLGDGSVIEMDVPVVYACQRYEGLDVSHDVASTTPSATPTPTDSATPTTEATPTPSQTASASSASPTAYACGSSGGTGGRN